MFLPFEIENKLLIVIPALRIAVKPALGDHPIVKLKVVAQNRWLLNEGRLLGVVLSLYCEFVSWLPDRLKFKTSRYRRNNWCVFSLNLCHTSIYPTILSWSSDHLKFKTCRCPWFVGRAERVWHCRVVCDGQVHNIRSTGLAGFCRLVEKPLFPWKKRGGKNSFCQQKSGQNRFCHINFEALCQNQAYVGKKTKKWALALPVP